MKLKVVVDFDLCESNALCQREAPAVFKVNDQDFLDILQEYPPDTEIERVREAVRRCPRQAISLVDEP